MDPTAAPRPSSNERLSLTPLGPGGRPFARWRLLVSLLALAGLAAVAFLLLWEDGPRFVGGLSDEARAQLDRAPPGTRRNVRRAVARSGVEESDTWAHIGLWASATVLVGLATWSWRSLVVAVVLLVGASTGLELVQDQVAPTRIYERSDLVANGLGIALGLAVVLVVSTGSGIPARLRRLSARRRRSSSHEG